VGTVRFAAAIADARNDADTTYYEYYQVIDFLQNLIYERMV